MSSNRIYFQTTLQFPFCTFRKIEFKKIRQDTKKYAILKPTILISELTIIIFNLKKELHTIDCVIHCGNSNFTPFSHPQTPQKRKRYKKNESTLHFSLHELKNKPKRKTTSERQVNTSQDCNLKMCK